MNGAGWQDESGDVGFVGDREVLTTPAATDTARLVKDKHYLIVSKTVGSSEDMGTK